MAIVDGGWERWVREQRSTNAALPTVDGTLFVPRFDDGRLAEIEFVKESLASAGDNPSGFLFEATQGSLMSHPENM